jgi:hypothetical protein
MTIEKKTNDQGNPTADPVVIFAQAGGAAYATIIPAKPASAGGPEVPKPAER